MRLAWDVVLYDTGPAMRPKVAGRDTDDILYVNHGLSEVLKYRNPLRGSEALGVQNFSAPYRNRPLLFLGD